MKYLKTFENLCKDPIIYFAHPINTYGTKIESDCVNLIKLKFNNCKIINPGDDFYQIDFKKYRDLNPNNYMVYFKNLVDSCSHIVYLPFRNNKIGAGIWYEIKNLYSFADNIFEIDLSNNQINKVSFDYVNDNKLSIEETRELIKKEY